MVDLAYLAAAVAFILGLRQLGSPRTARSGNRMAAIGMLAAIILTLVSEDIVNWVTVGAGLAVGAGLGGWFAVRVQMTSMPQMVAAFNGFGGIASALVAAVAVREADLQAIEAETSVSILVSLVVGAVTFTGSFVAYGKLQGLLPGRPLVYPGRNVLNGLMVATMAGVAIWGTVAEEEAGFWIVAGLALALGILAVVPIGGADMPVVISLLNSCSGLAAAAAGFAIESNALIIGGALVGAAGLILTVQMTEAMNRSLGNVLFAGFGSGDTVIGGSPIGDKPVNQATADDVAIAVGYAESVIFVPGYGLAVAQAQHALRKLADALEDRGVAVSYAIHPVAGRMPGHMNVLLAEADVPYEQLLDLEQADPRFAETDVVLILGANDVVNPSARDDYSSPIYGMPILNVDNARRVIVVKRSLSPGFAGIDNPLFYDEKTLMFFADAKAALEDSLAALRDL